MCRWSLILAALPLVLGSCSSSEHQQDDAASAAETQDNAVVIAPGELRTAFARNPRATLAAYAGHTVSIKGRISKVAREYGFYEVTLKGSAGDDRLQFGQLVPGVQRFARGRTILAECAEINTFVTPVTLSRCDDPIFFDKDGAAIF